MEKLKSKLSGVMAMYSEMLAELADDMHAGEGREYERLNLGLRVIGSLKNSIERIDRILAGNECPEGKVENKNAVNLLNIAYRYADLAENELKNYSMREVEKITELIRNTVYAAMCAVRNDPRYIETKWECD